MGLRELKARRTRDTIAAVALELFERQGYEATTMEQIAEAAEVAPTTLYRYYPTKDSTLVDQLMPGAGLWGEQLAARPPSEDLGVSLGHVLHERLREVDENADRVQRLRRQIDAVPSARARVLDLSYQEAAVLEEAIAARAGTDPSELWVQTTAQTWLMVFRMAVDMVRSTPEPRPAEEYAAEIAAALTSPATVMPSLPGRGTRSSCRELPG